jgi:hypothetical protein
LAVSPLSRYNAAPHPPDGFAAITAITKLTGPFGQRCRGRSRVEHW